MRITVAFVLACGAFACGPAMAQAGDGANGRYAIAPLPDGFVKLDTRTGAVTQCVREGSASRCALVADERQALQDEIDRLSRENADLRSRVAGAPPVPPSAGTPQASPQGSGPSDADVDRALSVMERFLRRFKDIMRDGEDGKPL